MIPPLPANEPQRLAALQALGILDTPPEERFDRLTRIAAHVLDAPIALISLVDAERVWFKSRYGLELTESSREVSFCSHAVLSDAPLIVPDATIDPRFADNPQVTGPANIKFYMGIPISAPDGSAIGSFCIIDHKPRQPSEKELRILEDLAVLVKDELGRQKLSAITTSLHMANQQLDSVIQASPLAIISCNADERVTVLNPSALRLFRLSEIPMPGQPIADLDPRLSPILLQLSARTRWGETVHDEPLVLADNDGLSMHLSLSAAPVRDNQGNSAGMTVLIADTSERARLAEELEQKHDMLEAVLDNVDAGVVACDEKGLLRVFNRMAKVYIGEPVPIEPDKWAEHYQIYDAEGQRLLKVDEMPLYRALQGEGVHTQEFIARPLGKPERTLVASGRSFGTASSKVMGAVLVLHDITNRKELERRLKHQASHDSLTGLPNRSALMEILAGAIARVERSGEPAAVLFMDLDDFKAINDTHGHQIGDLVLQTFAKRVAGVLRKVDTVARLSGDEFVVVAEGLKDPEADALQIAHKVCVATGGAISVAEKSLSLSPSIGIALIHGPQSVEEILRQADAAMYQAKQRGGGQVHIFDIHSSIQGD